MKIQDARAKFIVGGVNSGNFLLASLVGQYLMLAYPGSINAKTSITSALYATEVGFHPVIPTSLGTDGNDSVNTGRLLRNKADPDQLILVQRDPLDVLAHTYLEHKEMHPALKVQTFLDDVAGITTVNNFTMYCNFANFQWGEVVKFEQLVLAPEKTLTRILNRVKAELNTDHINANVVETVVKQSRIKALRSGPSTSNIEKVGIHKSVFTPEQIEYIKSRLV